jgi:preprotein translocase subunit SecE
MQKIINYINGVKLEMSKVIWPKKAEITKLTLIVFIISGIVAGYVGGLDYLFTKLLTTVLTR